MQGVVDSSSTVSTKTKERGFSLSLLFCENVINDESLRRSRIVLRFKLFDLIDALAQNRIQSSTVNQLEATPSLARDCFAL